jgi:hypothetical protein
MSEPGFLYMPPAACCLDTVDGSSAFLRNVCEILPAYTTWCNRGSVVGIATGYRLCDRVVGFRVLVWSRIFSTLSRPALGSTQPPIQWVRGAFSPGVKLTTRLQLVQRSRKFGFIDPLPNTSSWRSAWLVKHRDNLPLHDVSHTILLFVVTAARTSDPIRYIMCGIQLLR